MIDLKGKGAGGGGSGELVFVYDDKNHLIYHNINVGLKGRFRIELPSKIFLLFHNSSIIENYDEIFKLLNIFYINMHKKKI